ncbi:MAG: flagellar hook-basal body complex protein FliE [Syntrophales bacterium]|nr:flagellar hook-basal body complex protein FliE [Syntrophales bacterium]
MKIEPNLYHTSPVSKSTEGLKKDPKNLSFKEALIGAINEVSNAQTKAEEAIVALQLRNEGSLHETIIALEKADISLRAMLQIRNKLIEAYQEIMRMTI